MLNNTNITFHIFINHAFHQTFNVPKNEKLFRPMCTLCQFNMPVIILMVSVSESMLGFAS